MRMKTLALRAALFLLALPAAAIGAPTTLRVEAAQLQAAAQAGFPLEHELLEGFASLALSDPDVRIPVPGERLRLQMVYAITLATGQRVESGNLVVSSGLRYDPATRGLHLVDPQIEHLGTSAAGRGLPGGGSREALQELVRDYARTRPLYRLSDDDLAQVPGTLAADAVRVQDGAVVIALHSAPAR